MASREEEPAGLSEAEIKAIAARLRGWAGRGDVFAYFISGAKVRNPAAAMALIRALRACRDRDDPPRPDHG